MLLLKLEIRLPFVLILIYSADLKPKVEINCDLFRSSLECIGQGKGMIRLENLRKDCWKLLLLGIFLKR